MGKTKKIANSSRRNKNSYQSQVLYHQEDTQVHGPATPTSASYWLSGCPYFSPPFLSKCILPFGSIKYHQSKTQIYWVPCVSHANRSHWSNTFYLFSIGWNPGQVIQYLIIRYIVGFPQLLGELVQACKDWNTGRWFYLRQKLWIWCVKTVPENEMLISMSRPSIRFDLFLFNLTNSFLWLKVGWRGKFFLAYRNQCVSKPTWVE